MDAEHMERSVYFVNILALNGFLYDKNKAKLFKRDLHAGKVYFTDLMPHKKCNVKYIIVGEAKLNKVTRIIVIVDIGK